MPDAPADGQWSVEHYGFPATPPPVVATTSRPRGRRLPDRVTWAILVVCTLTGVWLGLDAPSHSPAAPPAPSSSTGP